MNINELPKAKQYTNKHGQPVLQHILIYTKDYTILNSYGSRVVILDHKNQTTTLGENWKFSSTTLKYVKDFLHTENNTEQIQNLINEGIYLFNPNLF